jgi:hypothetical protein
MNYTHQAHEPTEEGKEFLKTLTAEQKRLHELAQKMLGSSYFVERTHQFKAWQQKKKQAAAQSK